MPPADSAHRRAVLLLLITGGLIISVCMGLRQSLGLFMRPMALGVGVSATAFGFAIALQNIVWGIAQPFVGAVADRFGARPVLVVTALIFAAGLALMLLTGTVPGSLQIGAFLMGVGTAGCGFGVLVGAVSRMVAPERRSRTVGIIAAAGSLGTFAIAPLGQALIDHGGWQVGIGAFAAMAASMAVLAFGVREQRAPTGDAKSAVTRDAGVRAAVRSALAHPGYRFMTFAFFACGFQLVFLTTHLPAYLAICGVAPGVGATALALIGLFNAVGTYIFGILGTRYSQKHLLALIYLLRTVFIIVFLVAPISAATTLVFAAAMGFLWLGVIPLVAGIIGRVFGLTHFNTLNGIVFLSHQLGSFCGAWMGGIVFDRFGRYDYAWAALVLIGATAFTLQWLMDERPPRAPTFGGRATPAVA